MEAFMRVPVALFCLIALAAPAAGQAIDLHVIQESLTLHKADIKSVEAKSDQGLWTVHIVLTDEAAKKFGEITTRAVRKHMQIVVENRILMAPIVMTPIMKGEVAISGNFTEAEAREMAAKFK